MGKVITVAMHKGGVGKTSFISNIVGAYARQNPKKRILLIDTDAQGNLARSFGKEITDFEVGINDIFLGERNITDCIYNLFGNVDIIPATKDMAFMELKLFVERQKIDRPLAILDDVIGYVKEDYDYIFIDTPPSINFIVGNALLVSDGVIIPFQPEPYGVDGLIRIVELIEWYKESIGKDIKILGVLGMMVERNNVHGDYMKQARQACEQLGLTIFDTVIPKAIRYSTSVKEERKPATMTKIKKNDTAISYFSLLEELIEKGVFE
jgi:chromosome partitioning protein